MNEKFTKNAKVEKFTNMLGIVVRLIVIDPLIGWCETSLIQTKYSKMQDLQISSIFLTIQQYGISQPKSYQR